jgi:hypothetical protein
MNFEKVSFNAKNEAYISRIQEDWAELLAIKNIPELNNQIITTNDIRKIYIDALRIGFELGKKDTSNT